MTKEEWLSKAKDHKEDLSYLVLNYHPASNQRIREYHLPITAPGPEAACEVIREKIRAEYGDVESIKDRPLKKFHNALDSGDIDVVYSLLSASWFGVPESTGCWRIQGFAVAVDLLDDLPEEMYDAESI